MSKRRVFSREFKIEAVKLVTEQEYSVSQAAESFFGKLKTEWIHGKTYATRQQAEADIFKYIELFYNRQRKRQALEGIPQPGSLRAALPQDHHDPSCLIT